MTLFTKKNCALCDQLKGRFDLEAMDVKEEILEANNPEALAHLAWHSLVDTARRTLPILVLDDSTTVADFASIEHLLAARASKYGMGYRLRLHSKAGCDSSTCSMN
jgi:hypothetical protein